MLVKGLGVEMERLYDVKGNLFVFAITDDNTLDINEVLRERGCGPCKVVDKTIKWKRLDADHHMFEGTGGTGLTVEAVSQAAIVACPGELHHC